MSRGFRFEQALLFFLLIILAFNYLGINLMRLGEVFITSARIGFLLLLSMILLSKFSLRRDEFFSVIIVIVSIFVGGGENLIAINALFCLLFCFFAKRFDIEVVLLSGFWVLLLSLITVFVLLSVGVVNSSVEVVGERTRETFGFSNTNAFSSLVYSFLLLCIALEINVFVKYMVVLSVAFFAYSVTDNRSLLLAIFSYFIVRFIFLFVRNRVAVNSLVMFFLIFPILATQLSGYIVMEYPLVDIILSMRPSFSAGFIEDLPWYSYLIGGVVPSQHVTIDNSFLLIQGALGVPFLLYFTWKTFRCFQMYYQSENINVCAIIISFWFFCFSESNLIRPETIFGLIFWVMIFHKSKFGRKSENIAG